MGRPDEGTVVIEPVENGWLVLCWEEPDDDDLDSEEDDCPDDCEEDEDEEAGYDPSAAFAASVERRRQPTPSELHQMVTHVHMHDHGPEPRRYVFADVAAMTAFVTEKTTAFSEKRAAYRKALADRKKTT